MRRAKKTGLILTVVLIFAAVFLYPNNSRGPLTWAGPAKGQSVSLEADTIAYSDKEGIVEAEGNVTITRGDSVITARRAEYNVKTGEGHMSGGVKAVMVDVTLTADEIKSYGHNARILASGNVVVVKGSDRLTGLELEYQPESQYALMPASARLETTDAVMTADRLEAFLSEERAVGTGNVHIVSDVRKIDATANKATYYGLPKENAKVILTGNARVFDGGNLLTGETLTVGLYDKSVDAQGGRPKLVFTPQ